MNQAGGMRGSKNPGTPVVAAIVALASLKILREASSVASGGSKSRLETRSQKARSLSTRFSGGLPAMIAELTAPIEMPATHAGARPAAASAS